MTTFLKHYPDPQTARTALAHYHWLTNLAAEVELPALCGHSDRTLEFVHFAGRVADLDDLPAVAAALGRLHRAARQAGLAQAQTNSRYCTGDGAILAPFAAPRRRRLHELRARTSDSPLSHDAIDSWLDAAALLPVALYKDANPRNFLITDRGPVLVDFDSLTLAPVGYDLAKLVVTLAMTTGVLPATSVDEAVAAYTSELDQPCPRAELAVWAEMHHLLTRPYLGRHGYQHPWPAVRPWPAPDAAAAPHSREPRMPISAELVLARHGEAACNVAGRVGGPRTCTGLTTRGHDQADRLAKRLSAEPAFDVLYTSPRRRTQETATRLAHQLRLEPHPDPELRGLDHGTADGADWTDLKTRFGGRPQFRPHMPLAPGAESWNAFLTRTGNALARLLTLHTGQRILIAAHGETIEASFALLLNLPLSQDEYPGTVTGHTCLTRWQQHRNRLGHCVWMLTSHNDTHHLTRTVTAEQAQT